jgi:hypothetical protein
VDVIVFEVTAFAERVDVSVCVWVKEDICEGLIVGVGECVSVDEDDRDWLVVLEHVLEKEYVAWGVADNVCVREMDTEGEDEQEAINVKLSDGVGEEVSVKDVDCVIVDDNVGDTVNVRVNDGVSDNVAVKVDEGDGVRVVDMVGVGDCDRIPNGCVSEHVPVRVVCVYVDDNDSVFVGVIDCEPDIVPLFDDVTVVVCVGDDDSESECVNVYVGDLLDESDIVGDEVRVMVVESETVDEKEKVSEVVVVGECDGVQVLLSVTLRVADNV